MVFPPPISNLPDNSLLVFAGRSCEGKKVNHKVLRTDDPSCCTHTHEYINGPWFTGCIDRVIFNFLQVSVCPLCSMLYGFSPHWCNKSAKASEPGFTKQTMITASMHLFHATNTSNRKIWTILQIHYTLHTRNLVYFIQVQFSCCSCFWIVFLYTVPGVDRLKEAREKGSHVAHVHHVKAGVWHY